jgi:two-component system KDP operon response regulator KdpE
MTTLLLIDNDTATTEALYAPLQKAGYSVFVADTSRQGLSIAKNKNPDLVILDLMMPQMDGYEISHRLREFGVQSILILGPEDDERSVVKSLQMGADDYMAKPVETPVLLAKIRTILRRNVKNNSTSPQIYDDGQLRIDLENQRVELRGETIKLTNTEFRLLSILMRKAGSVVSHEDLIREIWGTDKEASLGSLKLYIHYLRQKLEDRPRKPYYVLAEWGIGYRLRRQQVEAVAQ